MVHKHQISEEVNKYFHSNISPLQRFCWWFNCPIASEEAPLWNVILAISSIQEKINPASVSAEIYLETIWWELRIERTFVITSFKNWFRGRERLYVWSSVCSLLAMLIEHSWSNVFLPISVTHLENSNLKLFHLRLAPDLSASASSFQDKHSCWWRSLWPTLKTQRMQLLLMTRLILIKTVIGTMMTSSVKRNVSNICVYNGDHLGSEPWHAWPCGAPQLCCLP